MWKQKQKNNNSIRFIFLTLAIIMLIGTGIYAAEKEGKVDEFIDYIENTKTPQKQPSKKKKVGKTPKKFVPTEVVTADQAVAFPTDI